MIQVFSIYLTSKRHIRNVILGKMAEDVESAPDITTQKEIIQAQIGKTMVKGQTWYYYFLILLNIYFRYVVVVDMIQCLRFFFKTVTHNFS